MKIFIYLVFINLYPSKNDIRIELVVTQTTKIQGAVLRYRIQIKKYETAPNFIQLNQNLISDCLLI